MNLVNKWALKYRAFCSGTIITDQRVLSSSHCFYTSRKRCKRYFRKLKVVGGILRTEDYHPMLDSVQQWRSIKHVYSQKYYRFPAYNLAVVELDSPWIFNQWVNKIPYASKDQDFDGVCEVLAVQAIRSWSSPKQLFLENFDMLPKKKCERTLLRNCFLYYCTAYDSDKMVINSADTEGAGLVCHGTGDPSEVNEEQGLLVGVTSLINVNLPILHHKIAIFNKWVTDSGIDNRACCIMTLFCLLITILFT